jgi:hypothetical protein
VNAQTQRLLVELQAEGRGKRVSLERVREVFHRLHPHLLGSVSARNELAEVVHQLAASGVVTLPKSRRLYDDAQAPALPRWIQLGSEPAGPSPLRRASEVAWCPELCFVLQMEHLTQGELRDLLRIQDFLRTGRVAGMVTARERSLELFGDEKRLEHLAEGRLFGAGRLSFDLLRCGLVYPPFPFVDLGGNGRALLILENKDTFHSACRAVEALAGRTSVRWVAYGGGTSIEASLQSVKGWAERPEELLYFGDLDADGLEIAVSVTAAARGWEPPLVVRCAGALYEHLVTRAKAMRVDLRGRAIPPDAAATLAEWLPPALRADVTSLLVAGGRWPQEAVTRAHMEERLRDVENDLPGRGGHGTDLG